MKSGVASVLQLLNYQISIINQISSVVSVPPWWIFDNLACLSLAQGESLMKAVRFHEFGGPEVLKYEDVPDPTPAP